MVSSAYLPTVTGSVSVHYLLCCTLLTGLDTQINKTQALRQDTRMWVGAQTGDTNTTWTAHYREAWGPRAGAGLLGRWHLS